MSRTHRNRADTRWDDAAPQEDQRARFQERVIRGDYQSLYDAPMRLLIEQGSAIQGIEEELGAVRFALAKLMNEEEDPNKLATGVARLASATVQLLKIVKPAASEASDPAVETINRILIELEKEARAARDAGLPTPTITRRPSCLPRLD